MANDNIKQLNLLKDPNTTIYPKIVKECLPDTLQTQLDTLSNTIDNSGNIHAGTITANNLNVNKDIVSSGNINIKGSVTATDNVTTYGKVQSYSLSTGDISSDGTITGNDLNVNNNVTASKVICGTINSSRDSKQSILSQSGLQVYNADGPTDWSGTEYATATYNCDGISYTRVKNESSTERFSKSFLFEQEKANSITTFGNSLRLYTGNNINSNGLYTWDSTCDFSFNGLSYRSIILFTMKNTIEVIPTPGKFAKINMNSLFYNNTILIVEGNFTLQFALVNSSLLSLQYNGVDIKAMLVQFNN